MNSVELTDGVVDFGSLVAHVEETGERVTLTEVGQPLSVLLPAAELVELEQWAQRAYHRAVTTQPDSAEKWPPAPEQHGPYTRYVDTDGVRMTFTRNRVVVAEVRRAGWLEWLEDWARLGRQSYMDPKQQAAFAEFLARQPPVGEG